VPGAQNKIFFTSFVNFNNFGMKFIYKAKDRQGNIKAGRIEARSQEAGINILQGYDLIVLEISPERKITFLDQIFGKKSKISKKDLAIFLRQFATLLESQVPLGEALKTLFLQAGTPAIKDLVFDLMSDLDAGMPLSRAVERRSDIFGDFYSQMIKSGEISGRLEEVLVYLADYSEHENDLTDKAKSAAVYPAFLLGTFLVISVVITVVLAPQMADIFAEFGKTPPLGTKILISFGGFFINWGILMAIVFLGIFWFFFNYFGSQEGRRLIGIYIFKVPIIGGIYKKIFISRFCETAGTLIKGGIPVVSALEVAGAATGNYVYQKLGLKIAEGVKRGENISNILKEHSDYFPLLVGQMVAVGEGTGRLDQVLQKASQYYQKEVDRAFLSMIDLLQPLMVIVIGILVAFLVAAVLLPIYQLAQSV